MYSVGVDIGGMSIKAGVVNEKGEILFSKSIITEKVSAIKIVQNIANLISEVVNESKIDKNQILGVGVGCPGLVASKTGVVLESSNLKWENFPLKEELERLCGYKVRVGNDADAATLGEYLFGVAKGYDNVVMLTLGTGIGGGIIVNGKLYEGGKTSACELGHLVLFKDGILCGCGRRGCVEQYASATALIRQTREAMLEDKNSKMWEYCNGDISLVNGRTAFKCEKLGDITAKKVVDNYVSYLSEGILDFMFIFNPDVIVIGGGLSKEGDNLLNKIYNYLNNYDISYKRQFNIKVVIAKLRNDAGIIGASSLIFE